MSTINSTAMHDTPLTLLNEGRHLFGAVPLCMIRGEFHIGGMMISPEATRQLEKHLRLALGTPPQGLVPGIDPKPFTLFVVTDEARAKLERVFVGDRRENEVRVMGLLNLDRRSNPSGAFEPLIEGQNRQLVKVELAAPADFAPPSTSGLRLLGALMEAGHQVKAGLRAAAHMPLIPSQLMPSLA
jgi:hypothetical protein